MTYFSNTGLSFFIPLHGIRKSYVLYENIEAKVCIWFIAPSYDVLGKDITLSPKFVAPYDVNFRSKRTLFPPFRWTRTNLKKIIVTIIVQGRFRVRVSGSVGRHRRQIVSFYSQSPPSNTTTGIQHWCGLIVRKWSLVRCFWTISKSCCLNTERANEYENDRVSIIFITINYI